MTTVVVATVITGIAISRLGSYIVKLYGCYEGLG